MSDTESQRIVKRTRRSKRKKSAVKNSDETNALSHNGLDKIYSSDSENDQVNLTNSTRPVSQKNKAQKSKKLGGTSSKEQLFTLNLDNDVNDENPLETRTSQSKHPQKNDRKTTKARQFVKKHFESVEIIVKTLDKISLDLKNLPANSQQRKETEEYLKENGIYSPQLHEKSKRAKKRKPKENEPGVSSNDRNQAQKSNKSKKDHKSNESKKGPSRTKNNRKKTDSESKLIFQEYYTDQEVENGLKNNQLIEGIIRINARNNKECYVSNPNKTQRDYKIEGFRDRNRALEGDVVIIKLNDEPKTHEKQLQTASVVQIKTKVHPRICVGYLKLQENSKKFACFFPRDFRIPRVLIPVSDWPPMFLENSKLYERVLFLARINEWPANRFATGNILEMMGQSGDLITEAKAILNENDLDVTPFDSDLNKCYPHITDIPKEEFEYREDLRNECIFTIDPPSARDLDDALSIKPLPNDRFEVGVHISDVSYFLKEDTPLNDKVAKRAVTVYLVDSVYPMLPSELTLLCSLTPGQDKMAFSVFWEMDSNGKIFNHRFARTIINSCAQLTYQHVQAIIENDPNVEHLPTIFGDHSISSIHEKIKNFHKIASNLRNSRFENGALKIDQPKLEFKLNPKTFLPESFTAYTSQESHQLVEEFMLLANITVATRLKKDFPKLAFLRSHPPPLEYLIGDARKTLEKVGIHLDVSSAGSLYKSMLKYAGDDLMSTARMMVINSVCAKPMARAKYFCAATASTKMDYWHYALNIPLYTHFTSPIRRYADVMVHRLLSASLNHSPIPTWSTDSISQIASNCNKQKYNSKKAGEQSAELYFCKYVAQKGTLIEDAVVLDVKENSIHITLLSVGINIRIYKNNLSPAKIIKEFNDLEINSTHLEWPGDDSKHIPSVKQIIEIFTVVKVALTYPSNSKKLVAQLLRPEST